MSDDPTMTAAAPDWQAFRDSQWHHYAIHYGPRGGKKLYVDGKRRYSKKLLAMFCVAPSPREETPE